MKEFSVWNEINSRYGVYYLSHYSMLHQVIINQAPGSMDYPVEIGANKHLRISFLWDTTLGLRYIWMLNIKSPICSRSVFFIRGFISRRVLYTENTTSNKYHPDTWNYTISFKSHHPSGNSPTFQSLRYCSMLVHPYVKILSMSVNSSEKKLASFPSLPLKPIPSILRTLTNTQAW